MKNISIAVASSGIVSTLLQSGKNVHSTFKLPLDLSDTENTRIRILHVIDTVLGKVPLLSLSVPVLVLFILPVTVTVLVPLICNPPVSVFIIHKIQYTMYTSKCTLYTVILTGTDSTVYCTRCKIYIIYTV